MLLEILRKLGTVKSQLHQKEKDINEIKEQMDELMLHQERLHENVELEKLPVTPIFFYDHRQNLNMPGFKKWEM